MRRLALGVLGSLALYGAVAAAQTVWPHVAEYELASSSCGVNNVLAANAFVYDGALWTFSACHDGRQFLRKLAQTDDNPPIIYQTPTHDCAAFPGFLPGPGDSCLPPGHPQLNGR